MNNKLIAWIVGAIILILIGYLVVSSQPTVSAQGVASLKAQPDKISVYVDIETKNLSLSDAQKINSQISGNLNAALLSAGISNDSIRLSSYNSYPSQEWDGNVYVNKGYVVSQQLIVYAENYSAIANIVDIVTSNGALVQSIQFELSQEKQNEYKAQVLKLASEDARVKAEAIAAGQGKSLGSLISLSSDEFNYYPMPYYTMNSGASVTDSAQEAKTAAANIAPSDLDVSSTVKVQYRLGLF